jgi:hypothetical protein
MYLKRWNLGCELDLNQELAILLKARDKTMAKGVACHDKGDILFVFTNM